MKAIVQHEYGTADVLALEEIGKPVAGPDDVLVRVRAAGVDQGVWHLMAGLPYLVRIVGYGLRRPKIPVPGMDLAGVVEAVGPQVTRFAAGDEVFGTGEGAFAEYACTGEDKLTTKPAGLTFEQAAVLPVSGTTALRGLRDVAQVTEGQEVLVIGAAGGVGSFAVQIAKALGARVTGVCSTTKTDLVLSIGADDVIDYTQEEITDAERRYDVIFDTAGRRPVSLLRRALTPEGTLVIIGGEGGGKWLGGTERQMGALLLSPFVGQKLRAPVFGAPREEDLQFLLQLADAGQLTPIMDRKYPLAQAAAAIRHLEEGRARGKVALSI